MKINEAGIALVKEFESCSLKPYLDTAGIATQGWGHTDGVTLKSPPIDKEEAEELLRQDLSFAENTINMLVYVPLNENQFSALTSLTFNIGRGNFRNSTLRKFLNQKQYLQAANEFSRWSFTGGKLSAGLTRRREAERALFLKPALIA